MRVSDKQFFNKQMLRGQAVGRLPPDVQPAAQQSSSDADQRRGFRKRERQQPQSAVARTTRPPGGVCL